MKNKSTYIGTEDLEEIYQEFISINKETPSILSIAGGSCSGKTSTVVNYFESKFQDKAAVINQDNFQLGEDFHLKNTSKWKWDDPLHFAPEDSKTTLIELKKGNTVEIPVFSLKENRRIGTQTIEPKEFIIFDGLYALYGGLEKLADISIYTEAPFYVRFIRRIFRYTYETNTGPAEVPVQLMLQAVYPAHEEFVKHQRENADYIFRGTYSFQETLSKIDVSKINLPNAEGRKVFSYIPENDLEIAVYRKESSLCLCILYKNKLLQKASINDSLFQSLNSIDFNSI